MADGEGIRFIWLKDFVGLFCGGGPRGFDGEHAVDVGREVGF